MKASAREWMQKAEEDFLAASALNLRRKKPLWNVVAFHVQQTVEKYLKARLEEAGIGIPKTHDLLHLLISPSLSSRYGPLITHPSAFSPAMPFRRAIRGTRPPKQTHNMR
jgi:hypothetical protein